MKKLASIIRELLDIPTTDPDDARRRKLLNILLLYVVIFTLVVLLASFALTAADLADPPENPTLAYYLGLPGALLLAGIIYAVNRYWSGVVAGSLFLLVVTASIFADPDIATSGQGLLAFSIPIVIASFLLRPHASFIIAGLVSLLVSAVKMGLMHTGLDVSLIPTFFLTALVSWIGASSLERALADLRILNRELDQRVIERTQELAEALVREQAEASKNQAILDSTADGVIVFGNDGKATVANPAVAGLLAHQTDEIVGRDIETLMGDDVGVEDREMIGNLLEGGEMQEPSVKFEWGARTLSASVAPVQLASGEEIGTVAVFRDFTREAEIDRMKSSFVSIASHELRTPLNAIMGYSEMLKEGIYGPLSDEQHGATERILANTRHMLSLANNLLDRAQIEAGTLMLNVTPFSPSSLIDDVIGAMEVLARNKGLELTGDVADDVPAMLLGDQQRLDQVVVNLVGNAIKFTEEGKIGVRVYVHDATHWAIAVSDTGIGIPKEAQSHIFEPFRRADESATREHSGAGLGLSIVKELAIIMRGEIILESEVGKGSTFTIILPLVTEEPDADKCLTRT